MLDFLFLSSELLGRLGEAFTATLTSEYCVGSRIHAWNNVNVSESVCVYICRSIYVRQYLCVYVFVSVYVYLYACVSVCVSVCGMPVSVSNV